MNGTRVLLFGAVLMTAALPATAVEPLTADDAPRHDHRRLLDDSIWAEGVDLVAAGPRPTVVAAADHAHTQWQEPRDGAILSRVPPVVRYHAGRVDGHAPIGVMGDHTHAAGETMIGVRYMFMNMDGFRHTDSRINRTELLAAGYTVEPLSMTMEMIMLDLMHAPSDTVTLFAMPTYVWKSMVHRTAANVRFRTDVNDFGDTPFGALVKIYDLGPEHVHLNLGATAPTGHIDRKDKTTGTVPIQLPYPMQTGSGTWDLRPGLTYMYQGPNWSWGHQTMGTIRLGRNSHGYSLGDAVEATQWVAFVTSPQSSFSVRVREVWQDRGDDGVDDQLTLSPTAVPTADPANQGGFRADILLGLNTELGGGNRFAVEVGAPLYQYVNGYQLEVDWFATAGWQLAF